jgi:hypothetical protein
MGVAVVRVRRDFRRQSVRADERFMMMMMIGW